ncbi:hypothetical protein BC835DRAFT_1367517 [Cytidiella melzeri]|nr:hypothetical protein BC835DRAFT_1367517 [Cytidiella melzeri]
MTMLRRGRENSDPRNKFKRAGKLGVNFKGRSIIENHGVGLSPAVHGSCVGLLALPLSYYDSGDRCSAPAIVVGGRPNPRLL